MRTRAQVNAWKEITAQHRREMAAFTASIAASRRAHESASHAAVAEESYAPSAASNGPTEPTDDAFVTPEKKTRKRKLSVSPEPAGGAQDGADISPAMRDAKRRVPSSPAKTKGATIRRTLDYTVAGTKTDKMPEEEEEEEEAPPAVVDTPQIILERVAAGAVATAVVGRAEERQQIQEIFDSASATRSLFVIGPPGTGKSSCVAHVASQHQSHIVVRVNCSTFTSPSDLFAAVGRQLQTHTKTELPNLDEPHRLDEFLQAALHTPLASERDCVFVLDEVDHLVRLPSGMKLKAQSLLRFLVRWAHLPNSKMSFIGILNGIDMHAQIAEFLAHDPNPTSVMLFPSYSLDELLEILVTYIQSTSLKGMERKELNEVVEPRALELIARKIAARDGDARRAIGLLQQCARACLSQPDGCRLTLRDVVKCTSSAISSTPSVVKQIQQLPRQPKLLLYAVTRLAECDKTTASLQDVCEELSSLQATHAQLAWIPRFRLEELQQHLGSLECYALVKQAPVKSKSAWKARLSSTVGMDTLTKAFQNDDLLKELPIR